MQDLRIGQKSTDSQTLQEQIIMMKGSEVMGLSKSPIMLREHLTLRQKMTLGGKNIFQRI